MFALKKKPVSLNNSNSILKLNSQGTWNGGILMNVAILFSCIRTVASAKNIFSTMKFSGFTSTSTMRLVMYVAVSTNIATTKIMKDLKHTTRCHTTFVQTKFVWIKSLLLLRLLKS